MDDEIGPVLTPEQWDTVRGLEEDVASVDAITFLEIVLGPAPEPEAAAAALLYDRAIGFTWEDVDALAAGAAEYQRASMPERSRRLRSLADRIAAVLPPRDRSP